MAFVNEWITPEDVQKFDMLKDERKVGGVYSNLIISPKLLEGYVLQNHDKLKGDAWNKREQDFTVDRERGCYLRHGGRGYLDFYPGLKFFMLNWQGKRFYFAIKRKETGEADNDTKLAYFHVELDSISIPHEWKSLEAEVLILIKEALAAYGEFGIRSSYTYIQKFNF